MILEEKIPRLITLGQRPILRKKLSVTLDILKSDKKLFEEGIASGTLSIETTLIWKRKLVLLNFYLAKLNFPRPYYRSVSLNSQNGLANKQVDQKVFKPCDDDGNDDLEIHIEM